MELKQLGYSDKVFYYGQSGEGSTFNLRMSLFMREKLDVSSFAQAANTALIRFPEFKYRPVIHDNKLFKKENGSDVLLIPYDGTSRLLGTDETNGYLFYFAYDGDRVFFSFFHGLTDYKGILAYIYTVLIIYAELNGKTLDISDEWQSTSLARLSDHPVTVDDTERFDPYNKYKNEDAEPPYTYDFRPSFSIPESVYALNDNKLQSYTITTSTSEFLSKTKSLKTSFAPLMISAICEGIYSVYSDIDLPVTGMLPVDLRRIFNTDTIVNFSDGVMIPVDKKTMSLSLAERCAYIRSMMDKQITRENFERIMANKVNGVKAHEAHSGSIGEYCRELSTPAVKTGAPRPVTYAITYPGRVFPKEIAPIVTRIEMEPYVRAFSVFAYSKNDDFVLHVQQRFENDFIAEAISRSLKIMGLRSDMENKGVIYSDKVSVEDLEVY